MVTSDSPSGLETAVENLELSAGTGQDPLVLNDLAVALARKAQTRDDPTSLLQALSMLTRARDLAPQRPEIAFNRALLFDRLSLVSSASKAWQEYLELPDEAGWHEEANLRLGLLRQPGEMEQWEDTVRRLEGAPPGDFQALADQLVLISPQRAREYGMEEALGRWSEDRLSGDSRVANRSLGLVHSLAKALSSRGGDCTLETTLARLEGSPEAVHVARALLAYRDGARLFRDLRVEPASAPLDLVTRSLPPDHPIALWGQMGRGGIDFYRSKYEKAAQRFRGILDHAEGGCLFALAGRARWGLGITKIREGRYADSLASFKRAEQSFLQAGERENLGAIQALLAENLKLLGERSEAWPYRFRALASLRGLSHSIRLHNLLFEAGSSALTDFDAIAALALQNEGVQLARVSKDPRRLVETLIWRSKIHLARGREDRALEDLEKARIQITASPNDEMWTQLATDRVHAEGKALTAEYPHWAVDRLTAAIGSYEKRRRAVDLAEARFARVQAHLAAGEPARAIDDLSTLIESFEHLRDLIPTDDRRSAFSETVQDAFDEMIRLEVEYRKAPGEALYVNERARVVPLVTSGNVDPWLLSAKSLSDLPDDLVVLEYALIGPQLFTWIIRSDGITFKRHGIEPGSFAQDVTVLLQDRGRGQAAALEAAKRLHRVLIPNEVKILPESVSLYVVPDKVLNAVPFGILRDPESGRKLVEDRPVAALLSAGSLVSKSRTLPASPRAVIVNNPSFDREIFDDLEPLSGVEPEVRAIGEVYPDRVTVGPLVTRTEFLDVLDSAEVLHYAGHAVANSEHPELSYFPLAPGPGEDEGGAVFANELALRRFRTLRLVVLSACNTMLPKDSRTGGFTGLARPFLDAGATAVLGTLWPVEDQVAKELMPIFHREVMKTGDAAKALRNAQLTLLHRDISKGSSAIPWGAFQVVGPLRAVTDKTDKKEQL